MKRVMKRALADRAKLDLPQSSGRASPPSEGSTGSAVHQNGRIGYVSSPPEGHAPLKVARLSAEEASPASSAREAATPKSQPRPEKETSSGVMNNSAGSVPPSPRPSGPQPDHSRSNHTTPAAPSSHKRPRRETSASQSQQSEEENDSSSAFYLQHQNRALAVELKSLQGQVRDLTREREHRRKSCLQAVQALHSLQATWTSLETALGHEPPSPLPASQNSPAVPSSTTGESDETAVEWTAALHRALQALGNHKKQQGGVKSEDPDGVGFNGNSREGDSSFASGELVKLGEMAANVTARAGCLQEWLWEVLRSKQVGSSSAKPLTEEGDSQKSLAESDAELERLRAHVSELLESREDLSLKERRLRRNIYRLDVGMITQKQLIQSVVANTENLEDDPERVAAHKEAIFKGTSGVDTADLVKQADLASTDTNGAEQDVSSVSAKVVLDLQRELEESRQEVASREKSIEEMTARIRDLELRVNELCVSQQSDGDKEKLESFEAVSQKLGAAEKERGELAEQLEYTREKWAQSAGNERLLTKSLDELQDRHRTRFNELTAESAAGENGELTVAEEQARKITSLEHKLRQALENVRQAETVRSNLRDALSMNESLQNTISELREKKSHGEKGEKSERSERHSSKSSSTNDNHTTPSSSGKGESHSESRNHSESSRSHHHHHHRDRESGGSDRISSEKAEKIYRENKKMRKEIAAIMASKEAHKAKLERVEKERKELLETNARLLKQAAEKDEMNAKSLSSILHLKSLTEQLSQERANLEQQVKSTEQLALAARLATNAKERLAEELVREKTALEEEMKDLEKTHSATKKELSEKTADCSDVSGRSASLKTQLANALKRCDECVAQAAEQATEIRKLIDALDKAERHAKEAREKLTELAKASNSSDGSANSGFTTDQLTTQIKVLKNRLACPVCHYRDKECIIMRCRHMHCRQCVEERLANRSRRCPTCNNPFGRNDLEDVFLG